MSDLSDGELVRVMRIAGVPARYRRPERTLKEIDCEGKLREWVEGGGATGDGLYLYGEAAEDALLLLARATILVRVPIIVMELPQVFQFEGVDREVLQNARVVFLRGYTTSPAVTIPGKEEQRYAAEFNMLRLFEGDRRMVVSGYGPLAPGKDWWSERVTVALANVTESHKCGRAGR